MVCVVAACGRFGFANHDDAAVTTGDVLAGTDIAADTVGFDAPFVCTQLFCDNFDAGIDASWTIDISGGSTAPATTPVHGGAHSVALVTDAITSSITNPRATLERFSPLPVAGAVVYARAWLYLKSPFDTTATYAQLINFADSSNGGISVGARHGKITLNDYPSGPYMESATVDLPLDRWFCLEIEMPSGSTTTARAFLDGAEVTDVALAQTSAQTAPDHIYIGFMWVNTITSQPQELGWLDDVVIDTSPIPCN
jgi:hypothetical protein